MGGMRASPAAAPPRLRALAELAEQVGAAGDRAALAERAVELSARLAGDAALLWLPSSDNERLICAAVDHPHPAGRELLAAIRTRIGALERGPVARVVSTGEPLLADGLEVPIRLVEVHPEFQKWVVRFGISSVAVLPLRSRGRTVGALGMCRDDGRPPYSDEDVLFLQAVADVVAVGIDLDQLLTDSTTTLDELRRQSELVNHVSDAVIVLDADQRVLSWNAAAERIYGYSPGEVVGGDLFTLLVTECLTADGLSTGREEVLAAIEQTGGWTGELRERHADGTAVETLTSFSALPDTAAGAGAVVVVSRDVTEQRHKEHLATHDALTGLPNRRLLSEHLQLAIHQAARSQIPLAVIFMDLNGFKAVNDRLGHDAGDEVLRVTARRLGEVVRASDVVARLGGDEFVVIATNVTAEGAQVLGERLLTGLTVPMTVAGAELVVPPSVGVVLSLGAESPDELLRSADTAMYEAKQRGIGIACTGVGMRPVPVPAGSY
jgi:diguanylate cyclase (GGDEF)-like protein/PAS domain S-box-containing protein